MFGCFVEICADMLVLSPAMNPTPAARETKTRSP